MQYEVEAHHHKQRPDEQGEYDDAKEDIVHSEQDPRGDSRTSHSQCQENGHDSGDDVHKPMAAGQIPPSW